MPTFVHPKAIQDIPKNVTLDYAIAKRGDDQITSIYGEKPKRVSKHNETHKIIWHRQGSTSESPKVSIKFVLRTKAQALDEETPARDGLLFGLYQSMLDEEMRPKTVDLQQTGVSYGA